MNTSLQSLFVAAFLGGATLATCSLLSQLCT
jgi:hypothetical protein